MFSVVFWGIWWIYRWIYPWKLKQLNRVAMLRRSQDTGWGLYLSQGMVWSSILIIFDKDWHWNDFMIKCHGQINWAKLQKFAKLAMACTAICVHLQHHQHLFVSCIWSVIGIWFIMAVWAQYLGGLLLILYHHKIATTLYTAWILDETSRMDNNGISKMRS